MLLLYINKCRCIIEVLRTDTVSTVARVALPLTLRSTFHLSSWSQSNLSFSFSVRSFLFCICVACHNYINFSLVSSTPIATIKTHGRHSSGNMKSCFRWLSPSELSTLFCGGSALFQSTGSPASL